MSNKTINKIVNTVIGYEEIIEWEEILKILEKFEYNVTEENYSDLDLTLKSFLNEGYSIEKVLNKFNTDTITKLDATVHTIINECFTDKYDSILIDLQGKISDEQRVYMFEKINEKLNEETYFYNRLLHLFKILIKSPNNNKEILKSLDLFINNNLLTNEKIRTEFFEIIDTTEEIINNDFINNLISFLIEQCLSSETENILKLLCKYKNSISIDNIKKLKSYIEVLKSKSNYKYLFDLYGSNATTMLANTETAEQLEFFIVDCINLSDDINKTLDFMKENFTKITLVKELFENYLIIDADITTQNKYESIIMKQIILLTIEEINILIDNIISNKCYDNQHMKKISFLLQSSPDFASYLENHLANVEDRNNNFKQNGLQILLIIANRELLIEYLSNVFEDLSDENLIINLINILLEIKIRYTKQYNSRMWEILNSAMSSTSSGTVKNHFEKCISELKLKPAKEKQQDNVPVR